MGATKFKLGDLVVAVEPPDGFTWEEARIAPKSSGTLIEIDENLLRVEHGSEQWWYTQDSLRPAIERKPEAVTNPKQAYGDKKVPMHLCPPAALAYMAIGMREGAVKYGAWNFRESNVEAMTYVGAIMRHLTAWVDGYNVDTDTNLMPKPHLAGAMASLAILIDAIESGRLVDNRPPCSNVESILKQYALP